MHSLFKISKAIILLTLLVAVLVSCQKEKTTDIGNLNTQVETKDYDDFAIILSKAVYNEPDLRIFLREEALKQFDKDYDVFYPFVKDISVDGERTFREILKKYDSDNKLESIEMHIPKLTIMIPDWSWVSENCFSVLNWDTSLQSISVCYGEGTDGHSLMMNGAHFATIPFGCFTDLPVLVLKSNERMLVSSATKGNALQYEFMNQSFDGLGSNGGTKSYNQTVIHDLQGAGDRSDWVPKTKINSQKVKNCYSMTSSIPGAAQRDYVYYGLNASSSTGYIDNTQYESIFRYMLDPSYNCFYETNDISFLSRTTGQGGYTDLQLKAFSWIEGGLEICFMVSANFATPLCLYDSCTCSEAFAVEKVKETIYYNDSGQVLYRVYIVDKSCLAGKWIYSHLHLFTWDVSTIPVSYTVTALEKDDGSTITTSSSSTWQYTTNYSINMEAGFEFFGLTCKLGFGVAVTESSSVTTNTSISYTNNDDDLGTFVIQYINPIVLQDAQSGARIKSYDTGKIRVTIMPEQNN